MRRCTAFIILAAAFALAWTPSPRAQRRPPRAQVRLAETADVYHKDEVSARTGETWLGLYVSKGGSALVPSVVKVEAVPDPVIDDGPGQRQKRGRVVRVNRKGVPVFLIFGAHGLSAGRVVTSYAGETLLADGSNVNVRLAGAEYGLAVAVGRRSAIPGVTYDDAKLILSKGALTQVIYDLGGDGGHEAETAAWKLLWAGDLDGDRRLDLYVQLSGHYNIIEHKLFLSSRARPKQLVRELADFVTSGC